jgi:hypothetical protein
MRRLARTQGGPRAVLKEKTIMPVVVDIQLQPADPITLQRAKEPGFFEGSFSLSLTNSRHILFTARIEIEPQGDAKAEWLSIPDDRKLFDFPTDKLQPIPIKVRVPESAAGKKLSFVVRVMDMAKTDELYDKQTAEVVVPAVQKPQPTKLPPWLIPVIIGGVLVLGGGVFAIVKLTGGPKLGSACDPAAPKCPDGVTCDQTKKQCLAKLAEACKHDEDCVTGHCTDDKCGALAIGEDCDPAASLCGEGAECSEGKKCLGKRGTACKTADQCITGACDTAQEKCTFLGLHAPCDPDRSFCADGLECPVAGKKCLASLNSPCTQPGDCVTNRCATNKRCGPSAMKPGDVCEGDCGAPALACVGRLCKGNVGFSGCTKTDDCNTNLICSNGFCEASGLELDTNRQGLDYTSFEMTSPDPLRCRQACESDTRCRAFTYVKPNSVQGPAPHCWLKSAIPPITTNICCVSGTVSRIRDSLAKVAGLELSSAAGAATMKAVSAPAGTAVMAPAVRVTAPAPAPKPVIVAPAKKP